MHTSSGRRRWSARSNSEPPFPAPWALKPPVSHSTAVVEDLKSPFAESPSGPIVAQVDHDDDDDIHRGRGRGRERNQSANDQRGQVAVEAGLDAAVAAKVQGMCALPFLSLASLFLFHSHI